MGALALQLFCRPFTATCTACSSRCTLHQLSSPGVPSPQAYAYALVLAPLSAPASMASWVIVGALTLQLHCLPFKKRSLNHLEGGVLGVLFVTQVGFQLFEGRGEQPPGDRSSNRVQ